MFLKKLVLTLIVANLSYFAYSEGWLASLLGGDASQREPERLRKQINTQAVRIEADQILTPIVTTPMPEATCAQNTGTKEAWLIYMGPYASKDLLAKKKGELAKLGVEASEVSKTSLPLGLSLGSYASEDLAKQALLRLNENGVRTAIVILWAKTRSNGNVDANTCPA